MGRNYGGVLSSNRYVKLPKDLEEAKSFLDAKQEEFFVDWLKNVDWTKPTKLLTVLTAFVQEYGLDNFNPLTLMFEDWNEEEEPILTKKVIDSAEAAGANVEALLFAPAPSKEIALHIICRRKKTSIKWLELYFKYDKKRHGVTDTSPGFTPFHSLCSSTADAEMARALMTTSKEKEAALSDTRDPAGIHALHLTCHGANPNAAMIRLILDETEKAGPQGSAVQLVSRSAGKYNTPIFELCTNENVKGEAVRVLARVSPILLSVFQGTSVRLPLHQLVLNHGVTAASLSALLEADPASAQTVKTPSNSTYDKRDGAYPLHMLLRNLARADWPRPVKPSKPKVHLGHHIEISDDGHIINTSPFRGQEERQNKAIEKAEKTWGNLVRSYRREMENYNSYLANFQEIQAKNRGLRLNMKSICGILRVFFEKGDPSRSTTLVPLPSGDSVLHFAVEEEMEEVIPLFLWKNRRKHALLNMVNSRNETALMLATRLDRVRAVAALLELPPDVLQESKEELLWEEAIEQGHLSMLQLLARQKPELLRQPVSDTNGSIAGSDEFAGAGTSLNYAVQLGHVGSVATILQLVPEEERFAYAMKESISDNGVSALEQAVRGGHHRIVAHMEELVPGIAAMVTTPLIVDAVASGSSATFALLMKMLRSQENGPERLGKQWDLRGRCSAVRLPLSARHAVVEAIDLSGNDLREFPVQVLRLPGLRMIDLSFNKITELRDSDIRALRNYTTGRRESLLIVMESCRLRTLPPEMFGLRSVIFDTTDNPLQTSFSYPAWFFGLTFTRFNLVVMDALFAVLLAALLVAGYLFAANQDLGWMQGTIITALFGLPLLGSTWLGLGEIRWTDRLTSHAQLLACCYRREQRREQKENEIEVAGEDWSSSEDESGDEPQMPTDTGGIDDDDYDKMEDEEIVAAVDTDAMAQAASPLLDPASVAARKTWGLCGSLSNVLVMLSLGIEVPILLSFSFSLPELLWPEELYYIFRFFLLDFSFLEALDISAARAVYEVGFWLAVILAVALRIALEASRFQSVAKRAPALLDVAIGVLSLPIFSQLAKVLDCTYEVQPGEVEYTAPYLDAVPELKCYTGVHLSYVGIGVGCFILFYPMAVLSQPVWQYRAEKLSVRFPSHFLILSAQLKLLLALLTAFFTRSLWFYLIVNVSVAVLLLLLVVTMPLPPPEQSNHVVMYRVKIIRCGTYLAVVLAAIAAVIAGVALDANTAVALVGVLVAVYVVVFIVCALLVWRVGKKQRPAVQGGDIDVELAEMAQKSNPSGRRPALCQRCSLRPPSGKVIRDNKNVWLCPSCIKHEKLLSAATSTSHRVNAPLLQEAAPRSDSPGHEKESLLDKSTGSGDDTSAAKRARKPSKKRKSRKSVTSSTALKTSAGATEEEADKEEE